MLFTSRGIMIIKREQHIPLLERMLRVTPPKVVVTSLARSAVILTNTHIFTSDRATVNTCWLQVHFLERNLVATSRRVLVTS